jgi:hypothetical protein
LNKDSITSLITGVSELSRSGCGSATLDDIAPVSCELETQALSPESYLVFLCLVYMVNAMIHIAKTKLSMVSLRLGTKLIAPPDHVGKGSDYPSHIRKLIQRQVHTLIGDLTTEEILSTILVKEVLRHMNRDLTGQLQVYHVTLGSLFVHMSSDKVSVAMEA